MDYFKRFDWKGFD